MSTHLNNLRQRRAGYCLWQIPLAYWLSRIAGFGPQGVFAAISISGATIAVVFDGRVPPGTLEAAGNLG